MCLFFLSAHRLGPFCLSAQRLFAPVQPLRNSAEAKWQSETKISNHLGLEHLPQVAQKRIVCVLASLKRINNNNKLYVCVISDYQYADTGSLQFIAYELNIARKITSSDSIQLRIMDKDCPQSFIFG